MKKTDEKQTTTATVTETAPPSVGLEAVLTSEEERILRMRSGASVPDTQVLGSKLDGVADAVRAEAAARLALIEAELLGTPPAADAARTRRIVEALKRKGD